MLIFCDSFDYYTTAELGLKYDVASASVGAVAARNGAQGLIVGGPETYVQKNISPVATVTCGFAVYVASSNNAAILTFYDAGGAQVSLSIGSTGELSVYNGLSGTLLGSTSSPMSFNAWHYLEMSATIDASSGSVTVRIDGIDVIAASGVNTKGSSFSSLVSAVLVGSGGILARSTYYVDDLYITDSSGSYNTGFLGDVKIQCLFPIANGTENDFSQNAASWAASTAMAIGDQIVDSNGNLQRVSAISSDAKTGSSAPSWATTTIGNITTDNHVSWMLIQKAALSNFNFVNENPADDDSSYLSSSTAGNLDRYTFSPVVAQSIAAVAVNLVARKDDSGTRSIRAAAKSGSVTADSGSDFALSQTGYANYQGIFETDPNTSAPWTSSGANAAEFGVKETA